MTRVPADLAWRLGLAVPLMAMGVAAHAFGWDDPWMRAVHARAPSTVDEWLWSCLTVLGLGWSAIIVLLAADRGDGRMTALLLPTFIAGSLLTHVPKLLLASPRPAGTSLRPALHVIGQAFTGSVSMPSGHALTASACAALFLFGCTRLRLLVFTPAVVLVAVLVAVSRVVVGAHWPSDVFVGAGLGLVAVALAIWLASADRGGRVLESLRSRIATRTGQSCVALIELGAAAGLLAEKTGYPLGQPMVLLLASLALLSAGRRGFVAWRPRGTPRAVEPA